MASTLVGAYDDYSEAQQALTELLSAGFTRSEVQLTPEQQSATGESLTGATTTGSTTTADDHSFGSGIRNFFRNLFGGDDTSTEHVDVYSEAVRRGHYLLTVNARDDEQSEQALQIMNRHDPVDIDERASQWRSSGWSGYDDNAPRLNDSEITEERQRYATRGTTDNLTGGTTEGATLPVIQEELQVGKREVQRGGVRIHQRVTETPVQESVRLREENVNVERRPVNQPASEADLANIKEGSFEVRETAEEAVVAKGARVVEEVVVGKEATERTETINDTLRRTDVEVEQLGASATGRTIGDDDEYRKHWQTTYGSTGGRYEDYAQAYRYGSTLAGDERYRGYRWTEAEPNLRKDWESRNAGTPWEKAKDAVRYGWEKVTR